MLYACEKDKLMEISGRKVPLKKPLEGKKVGGLKHNYVLCFYASFNIFLIMFYRCF